MPVDAETRELSDAVLLERIYAALDGLERSVASITNALGEESDAETEEGSADGR